jgi:hypothetical protein
MTARPPVTRSESVPQPAGISSLKRIPMAVSAMTAVAATSATRTTIPGRRGSRALSAMRIPPAVATSDATSARRVGAGWTSATQCAAASSAKAKNGVARTRSAGTGMRASADASALFS